MERGPRQSRGPCGGATYWEKRRSIRRAWSWPCRSSGALAPAGRVLERTLQEAAISQRRLLLCSVWGLFDGSLFR